MPKIVVSGLKPTGELHIGNYLGAIKQLVDLQEKNYERFYFIADYHALTIKYDPKEKREQIFNMAVDAIAAGINPKKSTIFLQSHVPAHNNLAWLLNTVTSTGRLSNMIEYKEKVKEGHVPNAGLLNYPILMAADILIYNADYVPVGEDQRQHLELTRDTARNFNKRFGKTFKVPEAIHGKVLRVMSLSDPKKQMAKSAPSRCLFLADSPSTVRKKIVSAQTDSHKNIGFDPKKRPGVSNLLSIYSGVSGKSIDRLVKEFRGKGYADFKKSMADDVVDFLKPLQQKRKEFLRNRRAVMKILEAGAKKANPIAEKKLKEAGERAGLI